MILCHKWDLQTKNQRVYVLHDDKDGQHIHLIANRIQGRRQNLARGRMKTCWPQKSLTPLELKYKLRVTVEKAEVKREKRAEKTKRKRESEAEK